MAGVVHACVCVSECVSVCMCVWIDVGQNREDGGGHIGHLRLQMHTQCV